MAIPFGAVSQSALSLTRAATSPSLSNVVGAATLVTTTGVSSAASNTLRGATQAYQTNTTITRAAPLLTSALTSLGQGAPFNALNGFNQGVKLATGFLDPKTSGIVNSVAGVVGGLFGPVGPLRGLLGMGSAPGRKPVALHTDSMVQQKMESAYAESKDVIFTFVRVGSTLEEATNSTPLGTNFDPAATVPSSVTSALGNPLKTAAGALGGVAPLIDQAKTFSPAGLSAASSALSAVGSAPSSTAVTAFSGAVR